MNANGDMKLPPSALPRRVAQLRNGPSMDNLRSSFMRSPAIRGDSEIKLEKKNGFLILPPIRKGGPINSEPATRSHGASIERNHGQKQKLPTIAVNHHIYGTSIIRFRDWNYYSEMELPPCTQADYAPLLDSLDSQEQTDEEFSAKLDKLTAMMMSRTKEIIKYETNPCRWKELKDKLFGDWLNWINFISNPKLMFDFPSKKEEALLTMRLIVNGHTMIEAKEMARADVKYREDVYISRRLQVQPSDDMLTKEFPIRVRSKIPIPVQRNISLSTCMQWKKDRKKITPPKPFKSHIPLPIRERPKSSAATTQEQSKSSNHGIQCPTALNNSRKPLEVRQLRPAKPDKKAPVFMFIPTNCANLGGYGNIDDSSKCIGKSDSSNISRRLQVQPSDDILTKEVPIRVRSKIPIPVQRNIPLSTCMQWKKDRKKITPPKPFKSRIPLPITERPKSSAATTQEQSKLSNHGIQSPTALNNSRKPMEVTQLRSAKPDKKAPVFIFIPTNCDNLGGYGNIDDAASKCIRKSDSSNISPEIPYMSTQLESIKPQTDKFSSHSSTKWRQSMNKELNKTSKISRLIFKSRIPVAITKESNSSFRTSEGLRIPKSSKRPVKFPVYMFIANKGPPKMTKSRIPVPVCRKPKSDVPPKSPKRKIKSPVYMFFANACTNLGKKLKSSSKVFKSRLPVVIRKKVKSPTIAQDPPINYPNNGRKSPVHMFYSDKSKHPKQNVGNDKAPNYGKKKQVGKLAKFFRSLSRNNKVVPEFTTNAE